MISLLLVINNLESGGAERQLLAVLPALVQRGFAPRIHVLTHRGALAERFEAAGIAVSAPPGANWLNRLPAPVGRPPLLIVSALTLLCLLYRQRPDIVHFILPPAYLVGGLASLLAPVRVRMMSRRNLNRYQRRFPMLARIERFLHRRMAAVVGNSAATLAELRAEGVPEARLHLLRNGVDLAPISAADRTNARASLGIADSTLLMICVANLIPYKGHADLIEALRRVRDRLPADWVLLCVGRDDGIGATLRGAAAQAGIAGNVRWLGSRGDVAALLAAADIGLLCSHEESFPNAILEYMAARIPVIATDVGGSAEAIQDGESGLLVPPRDPDRLDQAILELANDAERRNRLGQAGRSRAERDFTVARCIADYVALYSDLAMASAQSGG